ncbi:fimbrial protein [Shewanella algae]|uniref:fimbrial protein n=1 Tax=Shewanella algae TaxID=38313 RepID=UPI001AACF906|nr:fimbrial protein [Shewanella algae]MBO2605423.1 fimbrial protein [Shewanella algae]
MKKNTKILIALILACSWGSAQATCKLNTANDSTADGDAAIIQAGRINLGSIYLQPVGTILSTTIVSPTESRKSLAETVLMTCDYTDKDQLYELFATNGDDRVGGYWEIGNGHGSMSNDGMPGYYAIWFPYLALKTTHLNSGKVLSRYWQKAPLSSYEISPDRKKIYVKTKHLSQYRVELARVSNQYAPTGSRSNFCPSNPTFPDSTRLYTCPQPNFYVQIGGPGISAAYVDVEGEDSAIHYDFWLDNGVAFTLRDGLRMSYYPTCVIRNHTPTVRFPTISAQSLENGDRVESMINVSLECEDTVKSGVEALKTAMGFMITNNADMSAIKEGLINSGDGVTHLLSDGYQTDNSMAHNVGIRLWDINGNNIPFVRAHGYQASTKVGREAGWIPILENAIPAGSSQTSHTNYTQHFTASLEKLPNSNPVKPGDVKAQARIIIKVQ